MADHVLAIDQGTTSTRAIVFDCARDPSSRSRSASTSRSCPRAGWVEHDPVEIWTNTEWVTSAALSQREARRGGRRRHRRHQPARDGDRVGPAHRAPGAQRARLAGHAHAAADRRARGADGRRRPIRRRRPGCRSRRTSRRRRSPGSSTTSPARAPPPRRATCSSARPTPGWSGTSPAARRGGIHVTDVTNASRTLLMDLRTLDWSDELLEVWGIPRAMMPEHPLLVRGRRRGAAAGRGRRSADRRHPRRPAGGDLRSGGVRRGRVEEHLRHRQLPARRTPAPRSCARATASSRPSPTAAATSPPATRSRARSPSPDRSCSGCATTSASSSARKTSRRSRRRSTTTAAPTSCPAFSGLFAPYWRPDARGALVGLTRFVNKAHIARAALESTAFQTRDVIEAVVADTGRALDEIRVDGGMTRDDLLMQFQADILGIPVVRPKVVETTALGAAYAAGLATGRVGEPRRAARALAGGRALRAADAGGRARAALPAVEEGRVEVPRLGRRRRADARWAPTRAAERAT